MGILITVFLSGLRHGVDLDHLVAITDISTSQVERRKSFLLSTTYAAGHALVLLFLGLIAVLVGERIPAAFDSLMGRLVGATLIALGLYVTYTLIRYGRAARVRSRWMLVLAGLRRALNWMRSQRNHQVEIEHDHPHSHDKGHFHEHLPSTESEGGQRRAVATLKGHSHAHRHVAPLPSDPFTDYTKATAFGVGMIHGVGAETPTQLLLFATASGVEGRLGGIVLLLVFVAGLFIANSVVALATAIGLSSSRRLPLGYFVLAGVTALVSVYVGAAYLFDRVDLLPRFLGA